MTQPATLILIPGLLCDAAVWEPQVSALANLARVEVADHGTLDSLGAMAEAILAKAPARFALAGHSMGGRVAFEVMRRAAGRVRALAILDSGCTPLAAGEAGARETAGRWRLAALARSAGMRAMAEEWLKIMIHPARASDTALKATVLEMFERRTPVIFEAQIRALLARPDARPVLPTIACPTLVLCGRDDAWATLAQHEEMAALIPGSRLLAIADCGHMSTLERPEAVSAAMRVWLENS
jgi:pimeloyl-ACP methyl ester carboxylesterase